MIEAAAYLSPVGWAFVGLLLMIAGVAMIVFRVSIPLVNIITTLAGWSVIVLGSFIGIYGTFGEETTVRLAAAAFVILWLIGIGVIIVFEIGILSRREEAYGGEK